MSLTSRVLIGLVLGFAAGLLTGTTHALSAIPSFVEPIGLIFINAIRMTVIPLVVASLIAGVGGAPDIRAVGRLGGRAIGWFAVILLVSATIGVVVTPAVLPLVAPDPGKLAALRTGADAATYLEQAKSVPTFAQWLMDLVPVNPVRAAADGAMLPLIVFSLLFGVALMGSSPERRAPVLRTCEAVREASFVLVRWILEVAPLGVFALTVPLAAKLGVGAAGAVLWYIAVVSALCVLFIALVLYPLATTFGRLSLRDFARAALPVQAVAMSSRSSMASLPIMIEEFGPALGLSPEITGFLMPLSASMFRAGAGIGISGGVCFLAVLYGVHLSVAQLATVAVTTVLLSFSVPGIPAGSIIVMVPVLLAAGLPVEGVGILIGVDTIPDMFRTTTNVTGTMTVAAMLGARNRTTPTSPAPRK